MLTQSSRGVLAFLGVAIVGAALGVGGWDPFERKTPFQLASALRLVTIDPSAEDVAWQAQIKSEVRARAALLRICVDDPIELGAQTEFRPSAPRAVPLRFTLDPGGIVSDVIVGSMRNTSTDECVRSRLQSVLFSPPQHAAKVSVDLELSMPSSASITSEQPVVRGPFQPSVARAVIEAHRSEIISCYRAALQSNPTSEGRVIVMFSIAPKGQVRGLELAESANGDVAMSTCVKRAVREWIFPAPTGGADVHVSDVFNFTPTSW